MISLVQQVDPECPVVFLGEYADATTRRAMCRDAFSTFGRRRAHEHPDNFHQKSRQSPIFSRLLVDMGPSAVGRKLVRSGDVIRLRHSAYSTKRFAEVSIGNDTPVQLAFIWQRRRRDCLAWIAVLVACILLRLITWTALPAMTKPVTYAPKSLTDTLHRHFISLMCYDNGETALRRNGGKPVVYNVSGFVVKLGSDYICVTAGHIFSELKAAVKAGAKLSNWAIDDSAV